MTEKTKDEHVAMAKTAAEIEARFDYACATDSYAGLLQHYRLLGFSDLDALKGTVAAMSERSRNLAAELARAEGIAPKLYRTPSGKYVRWDAPNDLLPVIPLDGDIVPGVATVPPPDQSPLAKVMQHAANAWLVSEYTAEAAPLPDLSDMGTTQIELG